MRTCGEGCFPICDFCQHYAFNGEPTPSADGTKTAMVYVGKGHCNLHSRGEDPASGCNDFYCGLAAQRDEAATKQAKSLEDVTEELTRLWT